MSNYKMLLSNAKKGKIAAMNNGKNVLLVMCDSPSKLREIADLLEEKEITDMKALVQYPILPQA